MSLNVKAINALKPTGKNYRVTDGKGLYLEVTTAGGKLWRFKYRFGGKHKVLALGKYPDVSLARAREKLQEAREQLADGIDPMVAKKQQKLEARYTFKVLADEWWNNQKDGWTKGHAETVYRRLEMNIFPWLGDRPVREISSRELLENYRRIENRGALEVAKRVARVCNQIYVYALAAGIVDNNPAAEVSKALKVKPKRNWPAITESKKIQELLQAIDSFDGTLVVQCALRLAPLVFVRPGELRKAEWDEIDLENSLWTIPGRKMKTSREHLVPLSRQSKEILLEIQPLTGKDTYVFPSMRGKSSPMSENALLAALRRLGYSKEEIVPHGFRTTASTLLHEQGWNSRVIETQLAHVDQNKVRGVYNRAEYFEERTRMMQAWADFLDGLKQGTKILAFQQGA